jgi:hypothetical protein
MKKYNTINDLKNDFITGEYSPETAVTVNETVYNIRKSSTTPFAQMLSGDKGVLVYENEDAGWLMFLWGEHNNSIIPYDVRQTTKPLIEAQQNAIEDRIIPDKVEVHFLNLPISGSVIAKVDTGAEMCSIHAEQVQIDRGDRRVSFVCPQLSHSRLTVPMVDQQAIKTSGGQTTYRAVIQASIKVKGKVLKDIEINLNDRSEMEHPMLIGQNALEVGKFLIDPNIIKDAEELLTTDFLAELKNDIVTPPTTSINEETAQKMYEAMTEVGDISVGDLMKLLRTQVLKNLDDISY